MGRPLCEIIKSELEDGWGIQDIFVRKGIAEEFTRREIARLRESGDLARLYADKARRARG